MPRRTIHAEQISIRACDAVVLGKTGQVAVDGLVLEFVVCIGLGIEQNLVEILRALPRPVLAVERLLGWSLGAAVGHRGRRCEQAA